MMARLESPSSVRRHFQRENMSDIPSEKTIKAIYDKFIETGSVHDRERSGRPSLMTTEKLDEIEEVLSDNAMVSVRRVSQEVNLSKSTVHLAMRNVLGYKPYKMHLTQQLDDEDKDVRVVMAEALLPILDDENNDGLIFFSDEATFHISGTVHKHNCRIWARDNPHVTMEVSMNSPKVTIFKLSQWIDFKVVLARYFDVPRIGHLIVDIALSHSSLQQVILLRNSDYQFYSMHKDSLFKLIFPFQKVYIPDDPSDVNNGSPNFKFQDRKISLNFTRQYDVRHLDLQFQCWKLQSLVKILSAMPLLITLKIKGHCCCNEVYGWLYLDDWDKMLQNLKALQQVDIDICLAIPFSLRQKSAATFNKLSAQKIQTCKRINLTAERRTKTPGSGCVQISASLNMD
ncbi:unnamed protein product [Rotaria sp. Silwood2]|nr:unnamed protein product [Rotaria sp. Silwood2]CAF2955488.1 unnamed protein product [Rotaria sp. Silwood2]CAF2966275.1 unnamed protein product [Rotaria sp. Silwood2]CAF3099515.1 unnamed protein product [Rotaria sp. Silwood2]